MNNVRINALIDSGSTHSFINQQVVEQLALPVIKTLVQVSMASQSHSNSVSGYCVSDISISDRLYKQVKLFVLDNLCADIILGLDFQMVHQYVQFNFGGKEPPMNVCLLEMSGVTPPSLFPKLSPDLSTYCN